MTENKIVLTWSEFYTVFNEYVERENPYSKLVFIFGKRQDGFTRFENMAIYQDRGVNRLSGLTLDIFTLNMGDTNIKYFPVTKDIPFECLCDAEILFFSTDLEEYLMREYEVNSLIIKKTENGIRVEIEPSFVNLSIRNNFLTVLIDVLG